MQEVIEQVVDPEMVNNPENEEVEESKLLWDWSKMGDQWESQCTKFMDLPYVIKTRRSKSVPNGKICGAGHGSSQICHTRYKKVYYYTYSQGTHKRRCSEYTWTRKCPAGQGLYEKKIEPGTCMTEREGLASLGYLSFECPKFFSSGTGGKAKFNKLCRCSPACSPKL